MSDGLLGRLLAGRVDHWPDPIDYESEVDQLAEVAKKHGPVSSVLGLGEGRRRHLDLLAAAGYDTAVADHAAQGGKLFDAVLTMGSTVGWQVTDEALAASLAAMGRRLRPDGLLLFDVLDGNAVLRHDPRTVFTRVADGDTQCVHAVLASVDHEESVLRLQVRLWRLAGDRVTDRVEETWSVRFFLPRELELVLAINGFELLGTCPPRAEPDRGDGWHRLAWARKR